MKRLTRKKKVKANVRHCSKVLKKSKKVSSTEEKSSDKLEKVSCPLCGVKVAPQSLNRHVRAIHKNERKHKCSVCQKKFILEKWLKHHIKIFHPGEISNNKDSLLNINVIENSNELNKLDKENGDHAEDEFNSSGNGTDLVKCPQCSKVLQQRCLQTHKRRVHKNEKSYFCKECGRGFFKKDELQSHQIKIHGEEARERRRKKEEEKEKSKTPRIVDCKRCGESLPQKLLYKHNKKFHNKRKKDLNSSVSPLLGGSEPHSDGNQQRIPCPRYLIYEFVILCYFIV